MQAMDGTSRVLWLRARGGGWPVSTLLITSIVFALAVGMFLVARRLTGSLTAPLSVPQLLVTAVGMCSWVLFVHELCNVRRFFFWAPTCAIVLFAIGCSYPGNRAADWLIWLPAIGLATWSP